MRVWAAVFIVLVAQTVGGASTALAGGIEYAGAGTQALGRGGAVAARADDPMVLMYNPAGLVELRGMQLMLSANLALMSACVDPSGYYGWGAYGGGRPSRLVDPRTNETLDLQLGNFSEIGPAEQRYYSGAYDTVCMDQGVTPVPQFGLTARISEDFGVGLGLIFPAVTPQGQWGGETGLIRGAGGELRPAATRYMMMNAGTVGVFPTLGIAYRVAQWLRLGVAVQWGIINVDQTSMVGIQPGTTPANDFVAHVRGTDWFVPELTASIHLVPADAIDFVAGFHYQADLNAAGTLAATTGLFSPSNKPFTTVNDVSSIRQKFPWQLWAAFRYANRLAPRPRGDGNADLNVGKGEMAVHDAFQDERFDIELDARYEMNERHRDVRLDFPQPQGGVPAQVISFMTLSNAIMSQPFPDPSVPNTVIDKRWKDQLSVRLGGTYNILPGRLGLSLGGHYENRGVDPSYMQIDYWPVQRFGLHAGVRVRIAGSIDLVASYAHIFQETVVVGAPSHATFQDANALYCAPIEPCAPPKSHTVTTIDKRVGVAVSSDMPLQPLEEAKTASVDGTARLTQNLAKITGQPPYIVNSGSYRSAIDVLSLGVNMHF